MSLWKGFSDNNDRGARETKSGRVREDRMSIDINGELYHHNDDCTAECPRCHKAFQDLSEYDVWDNQKEIDCPHCGESIVLCCWVSIAYSTKLPNRTAGGEKP